MSRSDRVTNVFSSEREIVVGVDGSKYSEDALTWAVGEAKLRDAVLRIVCVAPIGSDVALDWSVDNALSESQAIVDRAAEAAQILGTTVVVRGEVPVGEVAETLVGTSEVADLLVVGARGRGVLSEFLLGTVSRSCAREARCPVVIVHALSRARCFEFFGPHRGRSRRGCPLTCLGLGHRGGITSVSTRRPSLCMYEFK